jgi:hypothetical protein
MNELIRYRVVLNDPHISGWIETGSDGLPVSGLARAGEIVEQLENVIGRDAFDVAATLEWLEAVEPAEDSGQLEALALNQAQTLEIIVKRGTASAKSAPAMPEGQPTRFRP